MISVIWKEYSDNIASGESAVAARSAELLSIVQLPLLVTFYGLAIFSVKKRNIAEHMHYMLCIALYLLPAGLAKDDGVLVWNEAECVADRMPYYN